MNEPTRMRLWPVITQGMSLGVVASIAVGLLLGLSLGISALLSDVLQVGPRAIPSSPSDIVFRILFTILLCSGMVAFVIFVTFVPACVAGAFEALALGVTARRHRLSLPIGLAIGLLSGALTGFCILTALLLLPMRLDGSSGDGWVPWWWNWSAAWVFGTMEIAAMFIGGWHAWRITEFIQSVTGRPAKMPPKLAAIRIAARRLPKRSQALLLAGASFLLSGMMTIPSVADSPYLICQYPRNQRTPERAYELFLNRVFERAGVGDFEWITTVSEPEAVEQLKSVRSEIFPYRGYITIRQRRAVCTQFSAADYPRRSQRLAETSSRKARYPGVGTGGG